MCAPPCDELPGSRHLLGFVAQLAAETFPQLADTGFEEEHLAARQMLQSAAGRVDDQSGVDPCAHTGDPVVELRWNAGRQTSAGDHEVGRRRGRMQLFET